MRDRRQKQILQGQVDKQLDIHTSLKRGQCSASFTVGLLLVYATIAPHKW